MERDSSVRSELQKVERAVRDNILRGLSGFTEDGLDELSDLLTAIMVDRDGYVPKPGIHPSSLGGCKRNMFYELKGVEAPKRKSDPNMMFKLDVSSMMHEWIQAKMSRVPWGDLVVEHEVYIPKDSEAYVCYNMRGRCDTLISSKKGAPIAILDYKFIEADQFNRISQPDDKYVKQLIAYEYGFGCGTGLVIYFNKRFLAEKKIYEVPFNEDVWEEAITDIEEVTKAVEEDKEPAREIDFFVCKNLCRYNMLCKPPMRSRL